MKTVFLDRDGVINRLRTNDYVKCWSEFEFLPNAIAAIRRLKQAGYQLIIVTNQSCISKGIIQSHELNQIHQKMSAEIQTRGGQIDAIYYCPHEDKDNCKCRKPKPGLLEEALGNYCVDSDNRFLVGDSFSDILAGQAIGCKTFLIGQNFPLNNNEFTETTKTHRIALDLMAATSWIIDNTK